METTLPISIDIRTAEGDEVLHLGTLITSSAVPIAADILLRNKTPSEQHTTFRLSESLESKLTFCQHYDPSCANEKSAPENINLLYANLTYTPSVVLPPAGVEKVTLRFLPVLKHLPAEQLTKVEGSVEVLANGEICASLSVKAAFSPSLICLNVSRLHFTHSNPPRPVTLPLTVQNLTLVDTAFQVSTSLSTEVLAFRMSGGGEMSERVELKAGESCSLDVTLEKPGHGGLTFAVQNVNNAANCCHVLLSESPSAMRGDECSVEVDCGGELDFGNCYVGCRTFRDFRVKSKAPDRRVVGLSSDRRAQVMFELLPDWKEERQGKRAELNIRALRRLHDVFDSPMSPLSRRINSLRLADEYGEDVGENSLSRRQSTGALFTSLPRSRADAAEVKQISGPPKTRLSEVLVLEPGQSRIVRVWYLPIVVEGERMQSDLDRGRLVADSFLMMLKLQEGGRVSVVGRSKVCESILRLEREHVLLGKCNVLAQYHAVLSVINCSDLPASACIDYVSQCVTAAEHEIHIPPRESLDVELSFVPRQVNPSYHKEITVRNKRNPYSANQIFQLRANCIDRQGISLHALFYKILAPHPTNEIDFGVTVANHPAIRAFRVRNITKGKLILQFTGKSGVKTYIPTRLVSARPWRSQDLQRNQDSLGFPDAFHTSVSFANGDAELDNANTNMLRTVNALVDKKVRSRDCHPSQLSYLLDASRAIDNDDCEMEQSVMGAQIDLGDPGSDGEILRDFDDNGEIFTLGGERSWLEFLKCLDERDFALLDSIPMFFSNKRSEVSYTERQFRPARRLRAALRDGYLQEADILALGPGAESLVVVSMVLTDEDVKSRTKTRLFEKPLIVNMLEFDNERLSDAAPTSSRELNDIAEEFKDGRKSMPRAVLLTVQACKSRMRISPLRQLNFGSIALGEQKDKAFTVVNLSDMPMLYAVKKENSEGNELRFNLGKGTRGVVGPYSTKVVPFIYAPTKEGKFEETIVVENRLDKTASCGLVVKATVVV